MKLYFRNIDSEFCHDLKYFQSDMNDAGATEMEVYTAEPDKDTGDHFWCSAVSEVCVVGDNIWDNPCGKHCEDYDPCNGKSGKCKFKTHCFEHGEKVLIHI